MLVPTMHVKPCRPKVMVDEFRLLHRNVFMIVWVRTVDTLTRSLSAFCPRSNQLEETASVVKKEISFGEFLAVHHLQKESSLSFATLLTL